MMFISKGSCLRVLKPDVIVHFNPDVYSDEGDVIVALSDFSVSTELGDFRQLSKFVGLYKGIMRTTLLYNHEFEVI